jgi:hypothetical protein
MKTFPGSGFTCFFSIIFIFLSGCGASNITKDYSLDKSKGTGILLASMTQAGLPSSFNMFVHLRGVDNKYSNEVPVTDVFVSVDWPCPFLGTSTEAAPCGRLAVIELPQGEYEFYSWSGSSNNGKTSTTVSARKEFSQRFKVAAGKVTYVGNMHFSVARGSYALNALDKRDRDLPLFHSKYLRITPKDIQINIIK